MSGFQPLSWVYFVQSSVPPYLVKIGRTVRNPKARISGLQVGSPVELNTVLLLRGNISLEELLHRVFREEKVRGEWFKARGRVAKFVKLCREHGVEYVGPQMVSELLEVAGEQINPEKVKDYMLCANTIHNHAMWNYPWLRNKVFEKPAGLVLTSLHCP